jgi:hypothetical protein
MKMTKNQFYSSQDTGDIYSSINVTKLFFFRVDISNIFSFALEK